MEKKKRWFKPALIFIVFLYVLDRLSKEIVLRNFTEKIDIIPGALEIKLVGNSTFLYNGGIPGSVIFGTIIIIMFLVFYLGVKEYITGHYKHVLMLTLILVGAFSNLLDRVKHGYVIDFISVPSWSIFNLSDLYIVTGVTVLLIMLWKTDGKNSKSTKKKVDATAVDTDKK